MTTSTLPTPLRRTKIVATLGPASDRPGVLEAMLKAGVDVVRLNFSHGAADDHRRRLNDVREIAQRLNRSVAALGDLQGPKIRIARFAEGSVHLKVGQDFVLDMDLDANSGNAERVGSTRCHLNYWARSSHSSSRRWQAFEQQGHQQAGRRPVCPSANGKRQTRLKDRN